ncbi:hypothetical protein GCM10011391_18250 [Pullulanibacillus camelliae]|uniref:Uncharacterized protein n=1 Tax=Pullulanibacillus camelliae TaxID=1707096 RepID=A0A8J2YGK4_9BACL|nr:retropepsin-like aspartic protease [Pullulanibacillus camelliae]GGE39790.1 hypothetical protein GCM10011391_18250 [Pullulanibacillus camelliae]
MKITLNNGLPMVSCSIQYQNKSCYLEHVLIDSGCAVSVFDRDQVTAIDLEPSRETRIVRMYGIGGHSECCLEMTADLLVIDQCPLTSFTFQLGTLSHTYGFDAILGIDFMIAASLVLDLKAMQAHTASARPFDRVESLE